MGFQTTLKLLFPPACVSCGEDVLDDLGLCARCWQNTVFLNGCVCDACGLPLPGDDRNIHKEGTAPRCDTCLNLPPPWAQGRAALLYEGMARKLILALKYSVRQDIARVGALWMARTARALEADDALLVPIPLHPKRLINRRHNQAATLARALSARTGNPWQPRALERTTNTPRLDGLSRKSRAAIMAQAIRPHKEHSQTLKGRNVLLLDDVLTSGATLTAATHAALEAGAAQVKVLVLARVAMGAQMREKEWNLDPEEG